MAPAAAFPAGGGPYLKAEAPFLLTYETWGSPYAAFPSAGPAGGEMDNDWTYKKFKNWIFI